MATPKRILLFAPLVLLGGLFLLAQSNLTGFWVLRVPTGDGNFRETFLDLKQDGQSITGKILIGAREVPITEGTFQDGKVHFVATARGPNNQSRLTIYDGVVEGGKISLTTQAPGREPVQGIAERTKPEAALPPPRLPLPALHDVPDNGLARTPPMGWNSWNKFAGKVDDAAVRGMADAMVSSGMSKAGYIYVNIDDTWEAPTRDAQGNIQTNRKFPGMKALADYVHSKGLKIGIYSSPGPKTCAGYEGSYGHEEQDARTYAAWGIDYLKYDWCGAARIYKDEEMQAVYQKMGDALQKTGRPIVYSLCQYGRADVWNWGSKVGGNAWRTTGDISDHWQSMDTIGFRQLTIPFSKPGHWNDPDMLEIGNGGMNSDEYRTHMSLWALLAAPLLAGNDLRTMSDDTKAILMNPDVIAIDQDPAAKPVKLVSEAGKEVILARPLKDKSLAVGLFNRGEQAADASVKWASLDLAGKKLQVRDLWKHQSLDAAGESFSTSIPAHGVVLLKVTPQ